MKSVKILIVVVLVAFSVNSARSEFETLVKDGVKVTCSVPAPMMERGRIKWYNEAKGHGFIERDGGNDIVFLFSGIVHPENLDLSKLGGKEVQFEVIDTPKGTMAINVEIAQ